ncbi:MAG: alpha-galactosidase, partial [Clostridia bacterium]|nr:alpha-galactosidase [Clostridia bacterium]
MHRERVSTKVTLQNTVYRSILNGRLFGNDPDVFLLRDTNISLTPEQRKALITLNALFGSVLMTSDNIAEYDEPKNKTLAEALELYRFAKVHSYRRDGIYIKIRYDLKGEKRELTYNTKKGVLQ